MTRFHKRRWVRWRPALAVPETEGPISILGTVETVLSVAILLFLWPRIGLWHILMAIPMVPMFMFRTPESTRVGLSILATVGNKIFDIWRRPSGFVINRESQQCQSENSPSYRTKGTRADRDAITTFIASLALYLVLFPVVTVTATTIKLAAGLVSFFRHPVESLAAVPSNYYRYCLCMDFLTTPESIPGASSVALWPNSSVKVRQEVLDVLVPYATLAKAWKIHRKALFWPAAIVFSLVVVAPAMTYRIIVKASFVVYWPILLSSMNYFHGDVRVMRRHAISSTSASLQRGFAIVIAGSFLVKVVIFSTLSRYITNQELPRAARVLVDRVLVPSSVPLWQWAAVVNAACAWITYFLLRPNKIGLRRLAMTRCVAVASSILTIYCAAVHYNFLSEYWAAFWSLRIPPLGEWWPH